MSVLAKVYGEIVIARPPVPATINKAGANYKSEVTHLAYSPRAAYREWLGILDAVLECGGDALVRFEDVDEPFLDCQELRVDESGAIFPDDSAQSVGHVDEVETGRVFAANGPWVECDDANVRAVMPNMLAHRASEAPYYKKLLSEIAALTGRSLEVADNPHRWEGMADVAVVGEHVVLTYAVAGHYDEATSPKSPRSSRDGVSFAADFLNVEDERRIYAELVYPHFHGDTVHFGARPTHGDAVLVHYPQGLWRDESARVIAALGNHVAIGGADAVENYAGNSRQIRDGVLAPRQVSAEFEQSMTQLGLSLHRLDLRELFGKGGGGPACATLYLPKNLALPDDAPCRYSQQKASALSRLDRLPERLSVDSAYFAGKKRG